ncbi:hypothetical protein [Photobacterium damselae]|uniref:hypothetical protein n=1 Tax=Photobacterium damselae TaxID=38293 RepID=UPI000D660E3F|nr:hypothetical protein [Photobacterium damselae]AWK84460.1 hypothetical protein BST98_20720 [Photobacterium damselae]
MRVFLYNPLTGELIGCEHPIYDSNSDIIMPAYSTLIEPPVVDDGYFAIFTNEDGVPPRLGSLGSWVVKPKLIPVIAYDCLSREEQEFPDIPMVPDGWTTIKPETDYDEWVIDKWVTNSQLMHEADYQRVHNVRLYLYQTIVDPLNNEAMMMRRHGDEAGALINEAQADAWYQKIKAENPFPVMNV